MEASGDHQTGSLSVGSKKISRHGQLYLVVEKV